MSDSNSLEPLKFVLMSELRKGVAEIRSLTEEVLPQIMVDS